VIAPAGVSGAVVESPLAAAMVEYLAVRRAFGYKLDEAGRVLCRFVSHLDGLGGETVTIGQAVAWSTQTDRGAARRLQAIRGFARYLQAIDPAHEVPPTGLVPSRNNRAVPHLYTAADIAALMAAARSLQPPLWAATTETVIGLLAITGMRIGEVLALNDSDIAWDTGVVTVRLAKFNKSRHVPLTATAIAALDGYRHTRGRLGGSATGDALFVSPAGQRLRYPAFKKAFDRLLDATGITSAGASAGSGRPRIHDFRHAFAVRTLLGWYRDGADVHALLPRLSTYLGHVSPAATYWYLSAAPELMALVADRIERVENDDVEGGRR
jgi:integrase/recombinase XerD